MPTDKGRSVRMKDPVILQGSERFEILTPIQVFSFSGAIQAMESGRFFVPFPVELVYAQVTWTNDDASGTSDFSLLTKDLFDPAETWAFQSFSISTGTPYKLCGPYNFHMDQNSWVSVECTSAGDHENVVVSLTGHVSPMARIV